MQIGLQTFTIRKDLKKISTIKTAFEKVKKLGINSIEIARISFDKKTVQEVAEITADLGIRIKASQFKLKEIESNINFTLDTHHLWGCRLLGISVIPIPFLLQGVDGYKKLAERLNILGERTKKEGIQLLYHHHHFEFGIYKLKDGKYTTGFEILKNSLDLELVKFMMDTYWLQRSGYDPAKFIEIMSGNVKVVHLRDYCLQAGLLTPSISDTYLGNGTLDFKKIIHAAEISGVVQLSIEQASKTPYADIRKSIDHLNYLSIDNHSS